MAIYLDEVMNKKFSKVFYKAMILSLLLSPVSAMWSSSDYKKTVSSAIFKKNDSALGQLKCCLEYVRNMLQKAEDAETVPDKKQELTSVVERISALITPKSSTLDSNICDSDEELCLLDAQILLGSGNRQTIPADWFKSIAIQALLSAPKICQNKAERCSGAEKDQYLNQLAKIEAFVDQLKSPSSGPDLGNEEEKKSSQIHAPVFEQGQEDTLLSDHEINIKIQDQRFEEAASDYYDNAKKLLDRYAEELSVPSQITQEQQRKKRVAAWGKPAPKPIEEAANNKFKGEYIMDLAKIACPNDTEYLRLIEEKEQKNKDFYKKIEILSEYSI
jgi:hypothetical protein